MHCTILKILKLVLLGCELSRVLYPNHQQVFATLIPDNVKTLMVSNCSSIEDNYFPLIKIAHSDEVYNSSFELVESHSVVNDHSGFLFSITCVAYFPIEWVVNYFYVSQISMTQLMDFC